MGGGGELGPLPRAPTQQQVWRDALDSGLRLGAQHLPAADFFSAVRKWVIEKLSGYSLCYVEAGFAYFTNIPLTAQWGDDWDDAPYEHNAGLPYKSAGDSVHAILKLGYLGPFCTPETMAVEEGMPYSPWSVQDLNRAEFPWLTGDGGEKVWAGASPTEFTRIVQEAGGEVFFPLGK